MFCEHCGAKLEPGDVFCTNCGAKVDYNGEEPNPAVAEPIVAEPAQAESPVEPEEAIPARFEKKTDDTQELPPLEDPTAQPEPVMVFVKKEVEEEAATEKPEKKGPSTGLKVAIGVVSVLVALLAAALIFLLVSGTSLSELTGKRTNGEYSYSYYSEKTTASEVESWDEDETETTRAKETSKEVEPEDNGEYYRVAVGSGNRLSFRAKPDEDSTKLDRIDNGTRLYITEIRGNWGKTTYGGETGWVCMTQDGDRYVVKD